MPISVEDALMRDAVARLEQAAHVNPKWIWDAKEQRAVLRSSVEGDGPLVVVTPNPYSTPQTAMAAVEATINGHEEEKP